MAERNNDEVGNNDGEDERDTIYSPSNLQKWWAAVVLGGAFFIISNPLLYRLTSYCTTTLGGMPLTDGWGPNIPGLLLHTLFFILIVRLILW